MKIGQLLSMQDGILPVEALVELANLQMQAPGMHASLTRVQFKSALGKYPEEMFRKFDPEPFAAALLDEIARGLLEETDYMREAGNLDYLRKGLAELDFVTVPRVHRELSTDRVLTPLRGRLLGTIGSEPPSGTENLPIQQIGQD